MKFLGFVLLLSCFNLLHGQSSSYDSINFFDLEAFSFKMDHSTNGKLASQEFTSRIGDLRKIQYYDSKGRITREVFFEDELKEEIVFTYLEKNQVIKRYDVLNKVELSPRLSLHIDYPVMARENGIEGEVLVKFTLNDGCIPTHFNIVNSLGHDIDDEVNNKVKLMIHLSEKYHIPYSDCSAERKPLKILFSLNE